MIEDMSYFSSFDFWDENASTSIVPGPEEIDPQDQEQEDSEEKENK